MVGNINSSWRHQLGHPSVAGKEKTMKDLIKKQLLEWMEKYHELWLADYNLQVMAEHFERRFKELGGSSSEISKTSG